MNRILKLVRALEACLEDGQWRLDDMENDLKMPVYGLLSPSTRRRDRRRLRYAR